MGASAEHLLGTRGRASPTELRVRPGFRAGVGLFRCCVAAAVGHMSSPVPPNADELLRRGSPRFSESLPRSLAQDYRNSTYLLIMAKCADCLPQACAALARPGLNPLRRISTGTDAPRVTPGSAGTLGRAVRVDVAMRTTRSPCRSRPLVSRGGISAVRFVLRSVERNRSL